MAACVLNTPKAVEMSVFVVRAFVKLRTMLAKQREIIAKLDELEKKLIMHDKQIVEILDAIKRLMFPPSQTDTKRIGFRK